LDIWNSLSLENKIIHHNNYKIFSKSVGEFPIPSNWLDLGDYDDEEHSKYKWWIKSSKVQLDSIKKYKNDINKIKKIPGHWLNIEIGNQSIRTAEVSV
jgi:hypothetical protein